MIFLRLILHTKRIEFVKWFRAISGDSKKGQTAI